ncbi:hypothetical protein MLD38_031814 [Melastoma candidum]|uniref:Uncharacterized protein n=1 Tax=Melastoma candidum TaxID=119954 RepID=A0ACB9MRG0_9MYRT|nr:hypothetical protein MLD38_031814 [Melastoma candidum]
MDISKVTVEIFTKLEQEWLSHSPPSVPDSPKPARILSIDGASSSLPDIASSVAASSLVHLEDNIRLRTSDPRASVADFFDLVSGTGSGAILAALLVADDGSGRPLFSARSAVHLLQERGRDLFRPRRSLRLLRGGRRFSGSSMEKALREIFSREDGAALTLRDTCKPLLVPCFDLNSSAPFVFSRADAAESPSFNFELWKVCRATSATPGLFQPFEFSSVDGKTSCVAIDGGLVMNNPSAVAITHVLHNKRDFPNVNGVEDLLVLSLGNGTMSSSQSYNPGIGRGSKCSTSAIMDIVREGVSETVDQMLCNAFCFNRADYARIQGVREKGMESLPFGGKRPTGETNGERIAEVAHRIVAGGKTSLPPSPYKDLRFALSPLTNGR